MSKADRPQRDFTDRKVLNDYIERRLHDPNEYNQLPDPNAPNVSRVDLVRTPTSRELAVFSDPRMKTCGSCKHFDKELGQREIARTKFLAVMTHEVGFQKEHMGAPSEELGICKDRGDMVVGPHTKMCEHYRENR